jgi:CRP-like cAMP-binding protein
METAMIEIKNLPEKIYKKGEVLLEEGKSGKHVFILKEGVVSVKTSGNEICKANTPGTIFGEMSVLLNGDYSATVVAEQDSTFFVIDNLPDLFKKNPEICMKVAQLLALRVMNMNHLFAEIKHEIMQIHQQKKNDQYASNTLMNLILKMDEFWGRDVLNPFGKGK